jgi:integrase
MSSLYKRPDSKYYWWTTRYKGRKVYKSTKMTQKHLAKKVKTQFDLDLVLRNVEFLGIPKRSPINVINYIRQYLTFVEKRKSTNTYENTRGVLNKFHDFLKPYGIIRIDDITVKVLDDYIDWLENAPKTKKNYLGIVSLMLKQAMKEGVIQANPADNATLPQIIKQIKHRPLEQIDLNIIFQGAGNWLLYYSFLYHTGLRAGDVAILTYGNINRSKKAIIGLVRKSRRIHEFPLSDFLLNQIPVGSPQDEPIFPDMKEEDEKKLNYRLEKPRKHMQMLLKLNDRPKATLHSFRVTFNNALRDLGLSIEDRQILLAHSSSETTKIYTHPNFDLASKFVNLIPVYKNVTKT